MSPVEPTDDPVLPSPVLIVEDEALMRVRLERVLAQVGYAREALTFAETLAEARTALRDQAFAMALVDLGLPDGNGVDLIREVRDTDAALPMLVISTWSTERIIVGALQAGATGYLLKDRDDQEIAVSIRHALRGGAPIDPFVAKRILEMIAPASGPTAAAPAAPKLALTPRETEILQLVGKGLTNLEISQCVSLSRWTVGCHVKNIYRKLAVSSRTEAVFEARAEGLLS